MLKRKRKVMEVNLIEYIKEKRRRLKDKKKRRRLKDKKKWTRADEMHYINFLKLVDNYPEFLEDLQQLRKTYGTKFRESKVGIFAQWNKKKVKDFFKDRKRFLNKYGHLLEKYGFEKGIDIMGLPVRRDFVQFPLSFCCQECGLIFNAEPYRIPLPGKKYRCPRCKSSDLKRHLRLIVDIFKETTERDIKDFINGLPSSAGAVQIRSKSKKRIEEIPTGWKFIEMFKQKIYGIKRSRIASKSERDRRWFELSQQGKKIKEIIKITKEKMLKEIEKLAFQKIRQGRKLYSYSDENLKNILEGKALKELEEKLNNIKGEENKVKIREEIEEEKEKMEEFKLEFKLTKADVEADLPKLIKQAIIRRSGKNT